MKIENKKVVILHYTLTDNDGTVIDKSDDGSFVYLHGAKTIIPGLENGLAGKVAGEELVVSVMPEDGYGKRDESMIQEVSKSMFEGYDNIAVGSQFQAEGPEGEVLVVTIKKMSGDNIVVDGNHPLAGVELNFDVKIIDIRDASKDELEHGHVHGPVCNAL